MLQPIAGAPLDDVVCRLPAPRLCKGLKRISSTPNLGGHVVSVPSSSLPTIVKCKSSPDFVSDTGAHVQPLDHLHHSKTSLKSESDFGASDISPSVLARDAKPLEPERNMTGQDESSMSAGNNLEEYSALGTTDKISEPSHVTNDEHNASVASSTEMSELTTIHHGSVQFKCW